MCGCVCWTNQCTALKPVEREPYTGEVVEVVVPGRRDFGCSDLDTPTRPCTRHGGVRDLHGSSFSFSGETCLSLCYLSRRLSSVHQSV